jgi:formiminotetrahydrofolate cyclodeaminase
MIMGWVEYAACAGAMKIGLQEMLQLLNLKKKGSSEHSTHKRTIWEDNIKMNLKNRAGMLWITFVAFRAGFI